MQIVMPETNNTHTRTDDLVAMYNDDMGIVNILEEGPMTYTAPILATPASFTANTMASSRDEVLEQLTRLQYEHKYDHAFTID